ncbi:MAG TPA: polyprenyl synthetase family protein [Saprospiraceae bacterium]|nr:polyprenyl synthetase family protein [Saprospiraceae bacterium]
MNQLKASFEQFLTENEYRLEPKGLFEPINYILGLRGKRFRPILLLAAYRAYQEDVSKAMPAAMAIEVFHNFTLLHDDIMDEAPLRRGAPTVHQKYDTNTAILSGDAMMISAYQWIGQYTSLPQFASILATFSRTALDVCRGQQMDMDFEHSWDITVDDYLEMIRLKTAVLLGASLKIGALIAGASAEDADGLYDFGIAAGLAFQIQDDILDSFGDMASVGKQVGGDIIHNKKTFLLVKTLTQVEHPKDLIDFMEQTTDAHKKVDYVKSQMIGSGALDAADMLRDDYYEKSLNILDELNMADNQKEFFSELALKMARRMF